MDEKLKPQLEQEFRENRLRASGASVQSAEQIQKQVRDTRQIVESQVLKNEQEMASFQQELNTQRNTLAGQHKEGEKAFGEALAQEREKQKPFAWNSDKDEENMQRLRDAAKWKDK
nr:hypothetical protein [Escherichia coli]